MSSKVTEEMIAQQSPESQVIIRLLLAEVQALNLQIRELKSQLQKLTPQNSSLPPSSQHAHAHGVPTRSSITRTPPVSPEIYVAREHSWRLHAHSD